MKTIQKPTRHSEPYTFRMSKQMKTNLEQVATHNTLSTADVVRYAVTKLLDAKVDD